MQEGEFVLSLFFTLFAFGIFYPPTEFESIGLTINNVFSTFLGSDEIEFIQYHLRRTCLTQFIHSILPAFYIVCFYFKFGKFIEYDVRIFSKFIFWNIFVVFAFTLPIISTAFIYYWCKDNYAKHPLVQNLQKYNRDNWQQAASDINAECRRCEAQYTLIHHKNVIYI